MGADEKPLCALVIGGGFGGIATGIALLKAGIDSFLVVEKASEPGGVWRDNVYPGCACDVPSRFYAFSFEQDWNWSQRFGRQAEILRYLNHCARKYGVYERMRFNARVVRLVWDDRRLLWCATFADGSQMEARAVVSAVGIFNQAVIPDIPGLDRFAGPRFHSSNWDHSVALEGRRIAVIGTGASAIQFVPELAKVAGRLHVCQRSPQYVQPKDMGPPHRRWYEKTRLAHRLERLRIYRDLERRAPLRYSPAAAEAGRGAWLAYLEQAVADPDLRRKLTPAYPFGCKRMLQSNDWYPALQKPNVELVSEAVTEAGPGFIRTGDGTRREVDVVVFGTGFRPTSYLPGLEIVGAKGFDLHDAWRDGAESYLGITVAGCPNFFMVYGPNTNGSVSIIFMIECQARYIARCMRTLVYGGVDTLEVRYAAQRDYNDRVHARLAGNVVASADCHTYFKLPGGKIVTQWPWSMAEYARRTRRPDLADYVVVAASPAARPLAEPAGA